MEEDDFNPEDGYVINYEKVSRQKNLTHTTRVLALNLMENPYLKVGDFFKNISDHSLNELIELTNKDDDDSVSETLLLSEMLSKAEGLDNEIKDMARNVGYLRVLVAGVSLHRKGMIKAYYNNMSFGDDTGDQIVFEKL